MKVFGQLERAQIESVDALPAAGTQGRVFFLTTDSKFYIDTGAAILPIVTTSQTQTLTNKTLTAPVMSTFVSNGVTFTLPTADGANGTVLSTNGSGALSFVPVLADVTTTRGDLLVRNASVLSRLAVGTAGKHFRSNGTDPSWGFNVVQSKTTTYTADINDDDIFVSASGGAWTLTLPTASGNSGKRFHIKKTDSTSSIVTIDGNGSETIDGALTRKLSTQYESYVLVSDGTEWLIETHQIPSRWTAYAYSGSLINGMGTISSTGFELYWRRVGDSIYLRGRFVGGNTTATDIRVPLPNSLTIAATAGSASNKIVGVWARHVTGANNTKGGVLIMNGGNAFVQFSLDGYVQADSPQVAFNASSYIGNGETISFTSTAIPVTDWEG